MTEDTEWREPTAQEKQGDGEHSCEETLPRSLDEREEILWGAQGASNACHKPESSTTHGREKQPERAEEEGRITS